MTRSLLLTGTILPGLLLAQATLAGSREEASNRIVVAQGGPGGEQGERGGDGPRGGPPAARERGPAERPEPRGERAPAAEREPAERSRPERAPDRPARGEPRDEPASRERPAPPAARERAPERPAAEPGRRNPEAAPPERATPPVREREPSAPERPRQPERPGTERPNAGEPARRQPTPDAAPAQRTAPQAPAAPAPAPATRPATPEPAAPQRPTPPTATQPTVPGAADPQRPTAPAQPRTAPNAAPGVPGRPVTAPGAEPAPGSRTPGAVNPDGPTTAPNRAAPQGVEAPRDGDRRPDADRTPGTRPGTGPDARPDRTEERRGGERPGDDRLGNDVRGDDRRGEDRRGDDPRGGDRRGDSDRREGFNAPGRPGYVPGGFGEAATSRDYDQVRRDRREFNEGGRTYIRESDRIIVRDRDRTFIRHDENARFRDLDRGRYRSERRGSDTVTYLERPGGEQIVTIVDDDGRLLRRSRRFRDGREVVIIDNAGRGPRRPIYEEVVDLPPPDIRIPRERYVVEYEGADERAVYEALSAPPVVAVDRRYTLDQVRYSPQLRARMRSVDIDTVTFETGSFTVSPDQAARLSTIAAAINQSVRANPQEVFLIEGYTDAVGADVDNLSLSDRRAQSVATVLTQNFQVPPENLTTQGYGEQFLKVSTQGPARENRRVTVRRITPLIQQEASGSAEPPR